MLLLTSECKSAPAQYTYKHRYYLVPPQSLSRKQIKTILTLCKPLFNAFMAELRPFKTYTGVQK